MNNVENLEIVLKESLDFVNNRYFYHITSKGIGSQIVDRGLLLEEPSLSSTTIEITENMMDGIRSYIENEYVPHSVMKREEMVILGIPSDETDYVIKKSNDYLPYIINNKYVLGYIDLQTLELFKNKEYEFSNYL